jgi:hypothetical protein
MPIRCPACDTRVNWVEIYRSYGSLTTICPGCRAGVTSSARRAKTLLVVTAGWAVAFFVGGWIHSEATMLAAVGIWTISVAAWAYTRPLVIVPASDAAQDAFLRTCCPKCDARVSWLDIYGTSSGTTSCAVCKSRVQSSASMAKLLVVVGLGWAAAIGVGMMLNGLAVIVPAIVFWTLAAVVWYLTRPLAIRAE